MLLDPIALFCCDGATGELELIEERRSKLTNMPSVIARKWVAPDVHKSS